MALSLTSIIDKVTPSQVKSIIKSGSKNLLDRKLGDITGVKLGQIFSKTGSKFKENVLSTIEGAKASLEAQIIGCLNHAIRDILNKNPILEKIIFYEDTVNRTLSTIRNRVESQIDNELRKIAYEKIKIQQVALYKQKILSSIQKICPGASPASPSQVNEYKQVLNKIKEKNKNIGRVADNNETLPSTEIPVTTNQSFTQTSTRVTDISNTIKKKAKEDLVEFEKLKEEGLQNSITEIINQSEKQIIGQNNSNWSELMQIV